MSSRVTAALAGTGVIGVGVYLTTRSSEPTGETRARAKVRENAISGAGVGGNALTGGVEPGVPGSGVRKQDDDPERKIKTDAPKEKLPSGGVGGGTGAGGASVRSIEIGKK